MAAHDTAERLFGHEFTAAYLAVKDIELSHFHNQITAWERQYLTTLA
jgi:glutamine synthetase